jgi:hypothetical protein
VPLRQRDRRVLARLQRDFVAMFLSTAQRPFDGIADVESLRPGAYTADVVGIPRSGASESLDPYPFRVVLQ